MISYHKIFDCILYFIYIIFCILYDIYLYIITKIKYFSNSEKKNANTNLDMNNNHKNSINNGDVCNCYSCIKQEFFELQKYHSYFVKYNIYQIIDIYTNKLIEYDSIYIQKKTNNNKDLEIFVKYLLYFLNKNYIIYKNDIREIFSQMIDENINNNNNNNNKNPKEDFIIEIDSKTKNLFNYLDKFDNFITKWDSFSNLLSYDIKNRNIMHDACILNDIHFIKGILLTKLSYTKKDIFGFTPKQYLSSGLKKDLILEIRYNN